LSLEQVHKWTESTSAPLKSLDPASREFTFRETFPFIPPSDVFPHGTFALATGVGKTRLMAAIMAYFANAQESSNFLILAPRRAILRQIRAGLDPTSPKYLFGSEALLPTPRVWHSGNMDRFGLPESELDLGLGPTIFLFSPQSFTGGDRRAARVSSDFADVSILEALQELDDLVILVDEAHHVPGNANRERRAWSEVVAQLRPMACFGFTATPAEADRDRVLHEYSLAECLRDGLYTKAVHVYTEVRPTSDLVTDQEWDRRTIDFGLRRLESKESALREATTNGLEFPKVTPVLLIAAADTQHAEEVYAWLVDERGLPAEEVLITHSERTKTEDDLERLQNIDSEGSKVRVVVNVMELSEGWDVTSVYVICPLRSMATFTNAIQTIGRGLRLPAGRRVGAEELDQLDVLCFAREKFEDIVEQATSQFGDLDDNENPIIVDPAPPGTDDERVLFHVGMRQQGSVALPKAALTPPAWDLSTLEFSVQSVRQGNVVGLDIARQIQSISIQSELSMDVGVFRKRVAQLVIQKLPFLSAAADSARLEGLAEALAEPATENGRVSLDTLFVAEHMASVIREVFMRLPRAYASTGTTTTVGFEPFDAWVPLGITAVCSVPTTWDPARDRRKPLGPWSKCLHECVVLDSGPELAVSKILDRSAAVGWWARNDPAVVKIKTPAGNYWPDFVIDGTIGGRHTTVLIGVKGEHLWDSADTSDTRIKAIHAAKYCEAATSVGGRSFEHWLVLGGDANASSTVEELRASAVALGSFLAE